MNKKIESVFLIHFKDPKDGKNATLKAREVYDSPLGLSFVCISDFIFDTESVVVKPSEEHMRKRLENVISLHLSIYSIISIEEIGENVNDEPRPTLKFKKDKSNLLVFPNDNQPNSTPN